MTGDYIYTCKAIALENGKKIKCTVNVANDKIQLLGRFADNAKERRITFSDFQQLSAIAGKEKLGLFKKDYAEIIYNVEPIRKLYFKNADDVNNFIDAIKHEQVRMRIEREKQLAKERKHKEEVNEEIYKKACELMSKYTLDSLKRALHEFNRIIDWKQSRSNINICKSKIEEIKKKQEIERKNKIYDEAISMMNLHMISSYVKAMKLFNSIIDWRNSKRQVSQCEEKLDEAYKTALTLMASGTLIDFNSAIKKFQELNGWKDSENKINVCKNQINIIKQKEENERKERIYTEAVKFASENTVNGQEKAIKLFTEVADWKDAKEQIQRCRHTKQKIENANFYHRVETVITESKQEKDNPQKYSANINYISKPVLDLLIKNPYFILGISCTSEQSKMLDVKDKIEKFARLKLADGYKSTFDLKNIAKPSRDISNIQAAIVSAKEISSKWLWFETDKYCSWWDRDEIFTLYEKEKDNLEYDLLLACLFNGLICDPNFVDSKKWNTVLKAIDNVLRLPKNKLLHILKRHIGSATLNDEEIISSFRTGILKPLTLIFENATPKQIVYFSKLSVPSIMNETSATAIIKNVTNICYPLDAYIKEVKNDKSKTDINKLISLINKVENSVYKNINAYISIVGSNSTYEKRIKKKYKQIIWDATTILDNNDLKDKAIPYIKEIYEYCDAGDKERLRNTYGFDKLGLSENELTPSEMNSLAIKFDEEGNISKSIYWFKKAAEAGDAYAQSNLAFRYFEGKGVPQNKATAKMWWSKAAAQGISTAQEALDNLFQIPHEHYDLGYVYIGYGEQKYIEVALNLIAYVRLLDGSNFRKYINGENYSYYGGIQTQTPVRIGIPQSGQWHVVVDNNGDDMGGIKSLSCYTKTRRTY